MIHFRKAVEADAPRITAIYANARRFMAASGNPNQWIDGYPSEADVRADISADVLWTACRGDEILAVFALIEGPNPTYAIIQGAWLNVCINVGGIKDEALVAEYRTKGEALLARALPLADEIYQKVLKSL